MALAIVNREPGLEPIQAGLPVWRTCLREVVFAPEPEDMASAHRGGKPLVEGDAYRLLLEILCGLQSPMLGETQVMGQFKTFLASVERHDNWLYRLGQRLLTDAREIRTKHLQGLGSRSYGSAVRRYLEHVRHTVLIGSGKLAAEILPFLADDGRTVDQWSRSPQEGARLLESADTFQGPDVPTAIIIAAPVASEIVDRVAACYAGVLCVIDLRGELDMAPLRVKALVVTLQDLFERMDAMHSTAARHIEAARTEIASRSRRYELRDELRPFGWDDLCA